MVWVIWNSITWDQAVIDSPSRWSSRPYRMLSPDHLATEWPFSGICRLIVRMGPKCGLRYDLDQRQRLSDPCNNQLGNCTVVAAPMNRWRASHLDWCHMYQPSRWSRAGLSGRLHGRHLPICFHYLGLSETRLRKWKTGYEINFRSWRKLARKRGIQRLIASEAVWRASNICTGSIMQAFSKIILETQLDYLRIGNNKSINVVVRPAYYQPGISRCPVSNMCHIKPPVKSAFLIF
jgi:hypothetical protein